MNTSSVWTGHSGVRIEYLATPPILVLGPASGRRYEFSLHQRYQLVDLADVPHMLRTPYFRALPPMVG